jgi:transposase
VLPLSPGRAERHGFEYYRHGTLSLYAAFNTKTGEVLGKTAERHTSAEFVAFLTDIVVNQPAGKEIHVIADNLSAHKTKRVDAFLAEHDNVHLHFTPTYLSWLNQVELWFAKIERDVIAGGVFTSVPDLKRKLTRYIRQYNKAPRTVKWKYFDLHVTLVRNQLLQSTRYEPHRLFPPAIVRLMSGRETRSRRPASPRFGTEAPFPHALASVCQR